MVRLMLVLVFCFSIGGCAIGVEHNYSQAVPQIAASQAKSLAVGVQDRRPYVVSGKKDQDFVGLSRGGFGNPFDITTESGRALADEFAAAIANGLRRDDASVTVVPIRPTLPALQARRAVVDVGAEKAYLLTLNEWKADTYMGTALIYNIELMVIGADDSILARTARQGKDNLGGSAWNPPAHSREVVPIAFQRKLEELFSDSEVAARMN